MELISADPQLTTEESAVADDMDIAEFERRLYPEGKDQVRTWKLADYREHVKRARALHDEIGTQRYGELNRELGSMNRGQIRVLSCMFIEGLRQMLRPPKSR